MPTTCAFNSDPIATPAANKVTLAGEEGLTDSRADRKELRAACAPSSSARRRRYLPSNPRGVLLSPSSEGAPNPAPNPAGDVLAAPAAAPPARPGARGALAARARVPARAAGPLRPRQPRRFAAVPGRGALDPQRRCQGGTAPRLPQQDPQLRAVPGLLLVTPRVGG